MIETEETPIVRDLGLQPLDAIMTAAGLDNHDIVQACIAPLTHKAVQRARKGRRLTPHMKRRLAETLNKALQQKTPDAETPQYRVKDLFTY